MIEVLIAFDRLTELMNGYLGEIIDTITAHGGDIIEFAGYNHHINSNFSDLLFPPAIPSWRCGEQDQRRRIKTNLYLYVNQLFGLCSVVWTFNKASGIICTPPPPPLEFSAVRFLPQSRWL